MNTHIYSIYEISKLKENPYVEKCTGSSIIYTIEFKKQALELHRQGLSPREIWRRAGFDVGMWRKRYAKDCIRDWKERIKDREIEGLMKTKKQEVTNDQKIKEPIDEKRVKRLELEIAYLKAENDFLVKLRAKRAESNSGRKTNTK
jgi:hypothetical protein